MDPRTRRAHNDQHTTITDVLDLPKDKQRLLRWMQGRSAHSFSAIVGFLQQSEEQVRQLLDELQEQGFVKAITTEDEPQYQTHITSMRRQRHQQDTSSIFDVLIDDD